MQLTNLVVLVGSPTIQPPLSTKPVLIELQPCTFVSSDLLNSSCPLHAVKGTGLSLHRQHQFLAGLASEDWTA